jgi:hypothetical protein
LFTIQSQKNVVINEYPADKTTTDDYWLTCLGLQLYKDVLVLQSPTDWLNDNHINAAMRLLCSQYPEINGFQDTSRQVMNGYKPSLHPFVQITLVCNSHWVCVSSLGCESNEVKVYDSLLSTIHHLNFSEAIGVHRGENHYKTDGCTTAK